jgi:hypothetical protein
MHLSAHADHRDSPNQPGRPSAARIDGNVPGDPLNRIREVLAFFRAIAERHRLAFSYESPPYAELAFKLPRQDHLAFDLSMVLQNRDEFCLQREGFSAHFFPFDDAAVRREFVSTVDGLISGECRILNIVHSASDTILESRLQKIAGMSWSDQRVCHLVRWRSVLWRMGVPIGQVEAREFRNFAANAPA